MQKRLLWISAKMAGGIFTVVFYSFLTWPLLLLKNTGTSLSEYQSASRILSPGHSAGSVDEINERLASDFKRVAPGKYKYEDSLISKLGAAKKSFST